MLHGIENTANSRLFGCFDIANRAFCDDFQSTLKRIGVFAQVRDQFVIAGQMLCLRQR